jgi:hypothetical protein
MGKNLLVGSALFLAVCWTQTSSAEESTWNQDGEILPLGVVKRCIGDQFYLMVVNGGVTGGGWALSITPALKNGQPERCKQPSASDVSSDPGPYGQRLRELEADRLRRKTAGYSS